MKPKLSGLYESTRARVKYNTGYSFDESDDESRHGYSTSLGRIHILSQDEKNMMNSYFLKEWFVFLIAFCIIALYPLYKYHTVKTENLLLTTNKIKKR